MRTPSGAMVVKKPRAIHGSASLRGRWGCLGMVAGGTGVAPFVQIARHLLDDASDTTIMSLLCVNRTEADILMKEDIERLARDHPSRFRVRYSLTRVHGGLVSPVTALPAPTDCDGNVMVLVCGTDGFVAAWAGPMVRVPEDPAQNIKKQKLQGPVGGVLCDLGFTASQVYKY